MFSRPPWLEVLCHVVAFYHQLSVLPLRPFPAAPTLAQVNVAEPWTAGSIATTIVLVGAIVALVVWRIRRGGGPPDG